MRRIPAITIAVLTFGLACRGRQNDEAVPRASGPGPAATAAAGAAAETSGICAEHGIARAVCTKCNPRLVPVFQAKGDWCAEHGFPESLCPICRPERRGQALSDLSPDEAPADRTKVRFRTKDTARLAGIETVAAVERQGPVSIAAVARIAYDAGRVARVNPRADGVVRTLHADVGSRVRKGTPLIEIESATVGAEQSKLHAARAHVAAAESAYGRASHLFEAEIVPAKDVEIARQEMEAARAEEATAAQVLRVVGASGEGGTYTLVAPIGGVVTRRESSIGAQVDTEDLLFEIVDPTTMWAEIDIPAADLAAVRAGQQVVLVIDGIEGREFTGTIDYIAPSIDPRTRTALARARLANPDGVLRANMYGRARILVGEDRQGVAVPRGAVQRAKGVPVVFVQLAVDLYETRRVRLGPPSGGLVEVAQGVRPGEQVVTQGSFLLKTETLRGSIGAGCCEAPGTK